MRVALSESGDVEIWFSYDERLVGVVKTLPDRRYDGARRVWVVPPGAARVAIDTLRPFGFTIDEGVAGLAASAVAELGDRANDLSVTDLNQRASRVLAAEFGGSVWVVAELAGINRARTRHSQGGILHFNLVDRAENGAELARVEAVIYSNSWDRIEQRLESAGRPFELADEAKVRVRGKPGFWPKGGSFQVVVDDLDVEYTLGDVARRREEIIRTLTAEGLHLQNPLLPVPDAPLRIGLATRFGSDAFHDVVQTLRDSGYAFELFVADVRVQGRDAERTLLAAMQLFAERGGVDAVLICRGGGSRLDLAAFDSEAIARAVAALPIPVVVGVGHEQDRSVLDAVARNCRTPALAAQWLVDEVRRFEARVCETARGVGEVASELLREGRQALDRADRELVPNARSLVRRQKLEVARAAQETARLAGRALGEAAQSLETRGASVRHESGNTLERATLATRHRAAQLGERAGTILRVERRDQARLWPELMREATVQLVRANELLDAAGERIALSDPKRVLERGYAILRRANRRVVRSPHDVSPGESLVAHLADGDLAVTSKGPVTEEKPT